jgi:hypothetical protein
VAGYGARCMNLRLRSLRSFQNRLRFADGAARGHFASRPPAPMVRPGASGHTASLSKYCRQPAVCSWFTFNPAGTERDWFSGTCSATRRATINPVNLPTGGRWIPNFDPQQIVNNFWGTLWFTFTDCNHGRVDFNSVVGYGAGSMNLRRLTQPAGLTCP